MINDSSLIPHTCTATARESGRKCPSSLPSTCLCCPNPATTDYDSLPLCEGCLNAVLEPDPPRREGETLVFITRERPPPGASYAVGIGIRW